MAHPKKIYFSKKERGEYDNRECHLLYFVILIFYEFPKKQVLCMPLTSCWGGMMNMSRGREVALVLFGAHDS
jgi:hypothetical protein